ncbi:putative amidase [Fulvimarina pelagi HTCC2506]|uniref:Indoleacetamide hydrolase n=1 Tax=Fulvimarina pelagi HTCC2506 TaxID=314231 RepID=Q0FY63_9HYPH|nr:amidase [Fulvimarina pelagi]EAU39879.1 putative amidase [Fulvimarina pelagi HTCC2506]
MSKINSVALPLADLAALMASDELTAESLLLECLTRIDEKDGALNAFVTVYRDAALASARRLDKERSAGQVRGPLHGIPIAIKDLADIEGDITGFGSRIYSTRPAKTTAPFVQQLEEAGMVIVGKTQMVEFAFGSWGTNSVLGAPRNPRMPDDYYIAGGSSSGSAVAVAADMVPAAIGSDTGGSVRIPAALCGTVGLKTSYGSVPVDGVAALSPSFDTIGPLTHHLDDARLIFAAMRRPELERETFKGVSKIIRIPSRSELEPIDPEIYAAFERSLAVLSEIGMADRPLELPRGFADYQTDTGAIMAWEAYGSLGDTVNEPDVAIDPAVRTRIRAASAMDEGTYLELIASRQAAIAKVEDVLGEDEVILLPTTPFPACRLSDVDETIFPMSRLTRFANYFDLCAVSLPVATTKAGLPIGTQICARRNREDLAISVAKRLQKRLRQPGST